MQPGNLLVCFPPGGYGLRSCLQNASRYFELQLWKGLGLSISEHNYLLSNYNEFGVSLNVQVCYAHWFSYSQHNSARIRHHCRCMGNLFAFQLLWGVNGGWLINAMRTLPRMSAQVRSEVNRSLPSRISINLSMGVHINAEYPLRSPERTTWRGVFNIIFNISNYVKIDQALATGRNLKKESPPTIDKLQEV